MLHQPTCMSAAEEQCITHAKPGCGASRMLHVGLHVRARGGRGCRRITNRDSARRMRQVRQQEEGMVRYEVQQLVEDNARLAQRLRTAEAAHDKAVEVITHTSGLA